MGPMAASIIGFLESPLLALVLTLFLGVLAVSGKVSQHAAQILLVCVWIAGSLAMVRSGMRDFRLLTGAVLILAACCFFVSYWIKPPLPPPSSPAPVLMVTSEVTPYIYAIGAGVGGVHFLPEWTDTRVFIDNRSDLDVDSAELYISTDMKIQGSGQVSDLQGVIFISEKSGEIATVDKQGHTTGVFQSGPTGSDTVRVRLSTIPKHSRIELVIALAVLNAPILGKPPTHLFADRRPPRWVRVKGTYSSAGKEYAIDVTITPKSVATVIPRAPTTSAAPETQRSRDDMMRTITEALSKQPKGTVSFWASEKQPNGSPNYVTLTSDRFSLSYDPIARTASFVIKATGDGLTLSFEPKQRHYLAIRWDEEGPNMLFVDGLEKIRSTSQFNEFPKLHHRRAQ